MIRIIQTKKGLVEYRTKGKGSVVLVLNGGHTSCMSPFEHEKFFLENGYRLIIPSRPGYGRTPLSSGRKAEEFADTISSLLDTLIIDKVIIIGISASGKTALHFAKNYPNRITKLILESAVTYETWPNLSTKIAAMILFNRFSEIMTWATFRLFGRFAPNMALKVMMRSLSSLDSQKVIDNWDEIERTSALKLLLASRSGSGFLNDIKHTFPFEKFNDIKTPTLIIASSNDKSVNPLNSIEASGQISDAELMMTSSESHLIWFGKYRVEIEKKIADFILK